MSAPTSHSQQFYGVTSLLAAHPDMRRLKRRTAATHLHGNKLWGSAYILMDYLQENPLPLGSRVLELGCGWGLASIYCAKYQQAAVTALDADPAVFPYLSLLAEHNQVTINTLTADFTAFSTEELGAYDIIIASDICFWDEMSETLFNLIDRAVNAGVKQIIIADPHRPPFIDVAEACIDEFFAELLPREVTTNRRHRGSILLIENA
ncbi:MAG: methyltransferase domain-containing protein [Zhongshania sp.]|uniref:class I SAM-dependent methyltransferase n=1 Tax=Zhongshania sp. TaxID=1971902 RepID=UPI0026257340|nr:methyltransferase domain-containing protein [Zhongshania sp.]MDF1691354.1 methyltransferase domain-containing protein [Zhongshania sp.]